MILVAVFGLTPPLLGRRLGPLRASGLMAVGIIALAVACQLAFNGGTIVGFVYPAAAGVLATAGAFAVQQRRLRALEAQFRRPADYFICYRRGQSELAANLIKGALERRLGKGRVFMDIHGLDSGEAWPQRLEEVINSCDAVLVLIGPDWLIAQESDGARRLDDTGDWVRREIETALSNPEITVVPVLHDGAEVPDQAELPPSMQRLTECHMATLTGIDIDGWTTTLTRSVQSGRLRRAHRDASEEPATT